MLAVVRGGLCCAKRILNNDTGYKCCSGYTCMQCCANVEKIIREKSKEKLLNNGLAEVDMNVKKNYVREKTKNKMTK